MGQTRINSRARLGQQSAVEKLAYCVDDDATSKRKAASVDRPMWVPDEEELERRSKRAARFAS